jgi:Domain of unknown function (DUF4365)
VLDRRNHQGKFGEDYVRTIASAAGLIVYTPDLDIDGIDLSVRVPRHVGRPASPGIDIQVKTTSRPRFVGSDIAFDGLDQRQFNHLAGDDSTFPRYLFLLLTPREPDRYIYYRTDGVVLRHLCFFRSLADEAPIPDPRKDRHRTVRIPQANVLTVQALLGMFRDDRPRVGRAR